MPPLKSKMLNKAFRGKTLRSSQELEHEGLTRVDIQNLVKEGQLERVARGLYQLANAEISENHSLVVVSATISDCVFCLLTALRFHELTTQAPPELWVAVARNQWRPCLSGVRFVQYSPASLHSGIESHMIEGVSVRITSPARTVADCFKFRNRIGLDVAVEALRDARLHQRCTVDELMAQARVCRVQTLIRPYLEALS